MPTFADPANLEIVDHDTIEVPPDASPLDFLCRVFRDARQPLSVRLKAAGLAAPFVHQKLAVTAQVQEGGSWADKIEAARKRSEVMLEARFQAEVAKAVEARLRLAPPRLAPPVREEPKAGPTLTPLGAPMSAMRRR
jgi:hypothetical protein